MARAAERPPPEPAPATRPAQPVDPAPGRGNPGLDEIKEAAAEDVATIQGMTSFSRPAGPDGREDDL